MQKLGIIYLWAALIAAWCLPLASQAAEDSVKPTAVLKYTAGQDGLMYVRIRLNQQYTGTFIVDTGTNVSMITNKTAAKLHLQLQPALTSEGKPFLELGHKVDMTTVAHFDCDNLNLNNVTLIITDAKAVATQAGQKLDGILGTNILQVYAMLLDFQKHEIILWQGGHLSLPTRKEWGLPDAFSVPLIDPKNLFYFTVPMRVQDGEEQQALVDIGANFTNIPTKTAGALKLTPLTRQPLTMTYAGTFTVETARVKTITVGGYSMPDAIVAYGSRVGDDLPPRLGLDFLQHHKVLLDFPQQVMYFGPAAEPSKVPNPTAAKEAVKSSRLEQ